MEKIIRIDLWDTHEDIESYFGKILTDYRRMLRAFWDNGYKIILYDKDLKVEWLVEFTNGLEYTKTQIKNGL